MSKWAGPEFGLLQIGSWLIVIVVWLAIVFFAWKYFMENPMVSHTTMTMSQLPICNHPNSGPAHFDI